MVGSLIRRPSLLPVAVLILACIPAADVLACPWRLIDRQTLTQDAQQATVVLVGTLANAKKGENGNDGTTDVIIETVLKTHEFLGKEVRTDSAGKKVLTIKRYVPQEHKKYKYLILCDVSGNAIEPWRGVAVGVDCDIASYINGALKLKDRKPAERGAFFFKYLDNAEVSVSDDAHKEFGNSDYKDFREMARNLPADMVVKWLQDSNTPTHRRSLYASMLGHCGKEAHAKVLRDLLEDPQKKLLSSTDDLFVGYALLKPKESWSYLHAILKDPSTNFTQRYAALKAVRFFWEFRPDVFDSKDLIGAVSLVLDQSDIADIGINDLRKWGRWEMTERVLDLQVQKSHDLPIIKRSILRFALAARDVVNVTQRHPKAKSFVEDLRKKDPQMVQDEEELHELEASSRVPAEMK